MMKRLGFDDLKEVKRVMLSDEVFDFIRDDGCKDKSEFACSLVGLLCNQSIFFMSPLPGCIFMFTPFVLGTYVVHTCILKELHGKIAVRLGKETLKHCFEKFNFNKIISYVPEYNRRATIYAFLCGFTKEGLIKKAWKFNDKLYNLTIVGLTKEEWLCQQQQ